RHLPYVGAYRSTTGSGTLYYQFLLDKIPIRDTKSNFTAFPWGGVFSSRSQTTGQAVGGGDWRFVIYPNIDLVTYAFKVRSDTTVYSSVGRANNHVVTDDAVFYMDVPADEAGRFESGLRSIIADVEERRARGTFGGQALKTELARIQAKAGPKV